MSQYPPILPPSPAYLCAWQLPKHCLPCLNTPSICLLGPLSLSVSHAPSAGNIPAPPRPAISASTKSTTSSIKFTKLSTNSTQSATSARFSSPEQEQIHSPHFLSTPHHSHSLRLLSLSLQRQLSHLLSVHASNASRGLSSATFPVTEYVLEIISRFEVACFDKGVDLEGIVELGRRVAWKLNAVSGRGNVGGGGRRATVGSTGRPPAPGAAGAAGKMGRRGSIIGALPGVQGVNEKELRKGLEEVRGMVREVFEVVAGAGGVYCEVSGGIGMVKRGLEEGG